MGKKKEKIVIDPDKGLEFANEDELFEHFSKEIHFLEDEFFKYRRGDDLNEKEFNRFEKNLTPLLEDPDEIWEDKNTIPGETLYNYIREFDSPFENKHLFHVAVVYLTGDIPSFVYLHFPTTDLSLVERYQRGTLIFDRLLQNAPAGALEGDALLEGEELAVGLYESMLKLRSENDIPEKRFRNFAHLRESAIEEADEIWRSTDSLGNVLVTFIKEFNDEEGYKDLYYIVVTVEDTPSRSHALLFSFPTTDKNLVDRYRHGENLQAEEVVQEASH